MVRILPLQGLGFPTQKAEPVPKLGLEVSLVCLVSRFVGLLLPQSQWTTSINEKRNRGGLVVCLGAPKEFCEQEVGISPQISQLHTREYFIFTLQVTVSFNKNILLH